MSMTIGSATASAWSSYAAWSRLSAARAQLTADLTPVAASERVLTADRAAVMNAAHEVLRIESRRASEVAHLKSDHRTFDLLV